jgi:hypothetical protein
MRLYEIAQQPAFDKQAILAELAKLEIESTSIINDDGSIDVQGPVHIPTEYTKIPVQFRNVSGDFFCFNTKITTLQGAPQQVSGDFFCFNTKIKSLQYAPQSVGRNFYCNGTKITSLHNIHKTHSDWVIGRKLVIPVNCTHILGLVFIRGIREINVGVSGKDILINHDDPFVWQEQLIEMGLIEQAQL